MSRLLNDKTEMEEIYRAAVEVFEKRMSKGKAIDSLKDKTGASQASLAMYIDIYTAMRNGNCYKMGTSAAFTKYLLEKIYEDNGESALLLALKAAKSQAIYRISVNNEQVGIEKVCREVIDQYHLDVRYEDIPVDSEKKDEVITNEDRKIVLEAITLPNTGYGKALMSIAEKYQLFSEDDLSFLTNRQESKQVFLSDYAMLRHIKNPKDIKNEVKDNSGYNRYYPDGYQFNGRVYAFTSQLYGYGGSGTHKDNRTPFFEWYLDKAGIQIDNADEWWPALSEYVPGISKEQWIDILNNPEYVGPVWGGVLAKYYDYGGAATCSQIADRYGGSAMSVRSCCTQFAKAIQKATDCALYDAGDDRNRYWPILFQGRKATSDEKGSWVWKLRPELKEALDEVDILRFLQEEGEPEMIMTTKEAIDQIKSYIAAKGFAYDDGLIENFYLSLKSKPFVILAGTSGTGKTRLVKLFAEAIGADYKMVSVRPDWSDGSDLFGHTDLNGNFIDGPICAAFDSAIEEPARPVLLCLDEMNLARVEYYLSDFLSVIESRDRDDSCKVVTDQIAQYDGGIPDNLYIVGTVNMDETTFPFSKKVLDRANTIEFNYVDLIPGFDAFDTDIEPLHLPNAFLSTEYLVLTADCEKEKDFVIEICDELQKVNAILRKANAHVGYRVRDEIVFYMLNNKRAENLLTYEQALDNEIMQKILPRIQGSQVAIRDLLIELFKYCMGNYSGLDTESGNAGKQMQTMADSAKYPESAKKIGYMMTRYEEDGFTSYWL